ncbi:MAG: TonB-dependent receptor plug domain-containing protein [Asticcacaulis sp.]
MSRLFTTARLYRGNRPRLSLGPVASASPMASTPRTPPRPPLPTIIPPSSSPASARRTARRLNTVVPVDVVTAQTLQAQGSTELAQGLSRVAPSLNFPRPSAVDGTDNIRPASLRGLAPDETLVLVDGKRRLRRPWSTSTVRPAAARLPSISTPFRKWRSTASKSLRDGALGAIRLRRHRRRHQPAPARSQSRRRDFRVLRRI